MSLSTFILTSILYFFFFFFQAEDGIRDLYVTGVQTCALPILERERHTQRHPCDAVARRHAAEIPRLASSICRTRPSRRSEEHTSELQSRRDLVCRLLLEKKKRICTVPIRTKIIFPLYKLFCLF